MVITVRNSSCGKVMFSQASVILSTGGHAWWGCCVTGGMSGGGMCMAGVCAWQEGMCGMGVHGRGHA